MRSCLMNYTKSFALILAIGLFSCATGNAGRNGISSRGVEDSSRYNAVVNNGSSGYGNHENYSNDFRQTGDADTVVIGVPYGTATDVTVQQPSCDPNDINCQNTDGN